MIGSATVVAFCTVTFAPFRLPAMFTAPLVPSLPTTSAVPVVASVTP